MPDSQKAHLKLFCRKKRKENTFEECPRVLLLIMMITVNDWRIAANHIRRQACHNIAYISVIERED